MKRKFVTAVLVLAMIMGMGTIAMAEESSEVKGKGEAGIEYIKGEIEVIEPNDPDIPKDGGWNATSRDIDFGKHDLVQNVTEQRYASWMEHRTAGTDYVGITIRNGTLAALSVSVEIEKFYVDPTGAKIETLTGFELDLVKAGFIAKDKDDVEGKANITNPNKKTLADPDKATANSSNKEFDKAEDHKEKKISVGNSATILYLPGLGVHAASWGGILTVPQNTVSEVGEAQAVMTWSINNTPADDNP